MICASCGQESSNPGICLICGAPLASQSASPTTAGGDPFASKRKSFLPFKRAFKIVVTLILWALTGFVGFLTTRHWSGGTFNAEAIGYLFGTLFPTLAAAVIVFLINRFRKEQKLAVQEVDKKYESFDPLLNKLDERIYATSASVGEKEDFLRGVHSSFDKTNKFRMETFRREEAWLQASADLYNFVLTNFSGYTIQKQKLVFRSDATLEQFNDLQSKAIELRKGVREARQKFEASRNDNLTKVGLTAEDVKVVPQDHQSDGK